MPERKPDASEKSANRERSDPPFAEPVVVPIKDSIDLHAFSPREIASVVEEYLEQCIQADLYEIRIIHGRGRGIQRHVVRSLLEKHASVSSIEDAPPESGGWGATLVSLKRRSLP